MHARDLFDFSTPSQIPKVLIVRCPQCEIGWNVASDCVSRGRCHCGAPLRKEDAR